MANTSEWISPGQVVRARVGLTAPDKGLDEISGALDIPRPHTVHLVLTDGHLAERHFSDETSAFAWCKELGLVPTEMPDAG